MNALKKIKLALYALSLIEIITFGEFFKRGGGTEILVLTLVLLAFNYAVYKYISKRKKNGENGK